MELKKYAVRYINGKKVLFIKAASLEDAVMKFARKKKSVISNADHNGDGHMSFCLKKPESKREYTYVIKFHHAPPCPAETNAFIERFSVNLY